MDNDAYASLDEIIEPVRKCLLRLAAEAGLSGATIEKWCWDEPMASLTWAAPDGIGRNVVFHIMVSDPELQFEVNAWQDKGALDGQMVRYWRNEVVVHRPLSNPNVHPDAGFMTELRGCYDRVQKWRFEDLTEQHALRGSPVQPSQARPGELRLRAFPGAAD
jgi:hypothetical protein